MTTDVGGIAAEEWRAIRGFPDYEVSNLGRVRRVTPKRGTRAGFLLAGSKNANGYVVVSLRTKGGKHDKLLSRIVCEAFHGEAPDGKPYCLHRDGVRDHNNAENLRWGSQAENIADAIAHGTMIKGERQGSAVLTQQKIKAIRSMRASGMTQQSVADCLGVSRTCISSIDLGRTWGHVQ